MVAGGLVASRLPDLSDLSLPPAELGLPEPEVLPVRRVVGPVRVRPVRSSMVFSTEPFETSAMTSSWGSVVVRSGDDWSSEDVRALFEPEVGGPWA